MSASRPAGSLAWTSSGPTSAAACTTRSAPTPAAAGAVSSSSTWAWVAPFGPMSTKVAVWADPAGRSMATSKSGALDAGAPAGRPWMRYVPAGSVRYGLTAR